MSGPGKCWNTRLALTQATKGFNMAQANVDNNTRRRDFLALAAAAASTVTAAQQALAIPQDDNARPFYGAECSFYPNCSGGCGLGCTKEHAPAAAAADPAFGIITPLR
jgi:hypothetical protein